MENVVVIYSETSSDSITEIEPPKKPTPPLIDIEVDELILNVKGNTTESLGGSCFTDEEIPMETPGDNPSHWTDDMKKFYNDDWGDEDYFKVEILQERMDKHPFLWQVSERDLLVGSRKRKSYLKCWNCCQYGHNAYKCKEPLHIPKCHMCGLAGHVENGCPNSICLNCGNHMRSYVTNCGKCANDSNTKCSRCSLVGHHFINCSDNWRRFHSTTGKIEVDAPAQTVYKSASELWCCNCGKKGHYQIHCHVTKQLAFPESIPFVASYENSFSASAVNHTMPVPVPQQFKLKKKFRLRKEENKHFQQKNVNNLFNIVKSLNKFNHVKKRARRKRKKDRNRNKFFQTPDFIHL